VTSWPNAADSTSTDVDTLTSAGFGARVVFVTDRFESGRGSATPLGGETVAVTETARAFAKVPVMVRVIEPPVGRLGTAVEMPPGETAIDEGQVAPPLETVQDAARCVDAPGGIAVRVAPSAASGPVLVTTTE
jgi:hypothetical protein